METNDKTSPITPEKDRNSVSMDLMHRMRLHGMAAAFSESLQATFAETMTPDSFLNWLLSREWDYRVARNIERLIKGANFRYNDASVAQIDYTLPRGLDRNQMERLASLDFVRKGDNLFITGCSGTGKSYLATALGYEACKAGMRVLYANASKLMGTLKIAKNKGTIETELKKIEKNSSSFWTTSFWFHWTPRSARISRKSSRTGTDASLSSSHHSSLSWTGMTLSVTLRWRMQYSTVSSTQHTA